MSPCDANTAAAHARDPGHVCQVYHKKGATYGGSLVGRAYSALRGVRDALGVAAIIAILGADAILNLTTTSNVHRGA